MSMKPSVQSAIYLSKNPELRKVHYQSTLHPRILISAVILPATVLDVQQFSFLRQTNTKNCEY